MPARIWREDLLPIGKFRYPTKKKRKAQLQCQLPCAGLVCHLKTWRVRMISPTQLPHCNHPWKKLSPHTPKVKTQQTSGRKIKPKSQRHRDRQRLMLADTCILPWV
uniref:Uncharacterized protein n=1 Tax=Anguilla anguilla TaxID=7936 RepID=A0A0E9W9L5_ANGAN